MTLAEKVKAVEEVFSALDAEINLFQHWSGLHCKVGCGKCCFKADITATVLEFLPFAHHLYKNKLAESWYERLLLNEDPLCVILNQSPAGTTGSCTQYPHRGLICRLFGFSARTSKYGKPELVTCQVIKSELADQHNLTISAIANGNAALPMMSRYHMKLVAIDDDLARKHYLINEAIRMAIETVLSYYAYRDEIPE